MEDNLLFLLWNKTTTTKGKNREIKTKNNFFLVISKSNHSINQNSHSFGILTCIAFIRIENNMIVLHLTVYGFQKVLNVMNKIVAQESGSALWMA